jgi:predicted lysophospholipase L1 biosynthesis ABC-type transport system permease subunit
LLQLQITRHGIEPSGSRAASPSPRLTSAAASARHARRQASGRTRSRRRDLALLKTLGFTRRQLAATVAWQSSVAVGVGLLAGVPLGIIAGRLLWNQFAEQIYAVPSPNVPVLPVVIIAATALALANLVAAWPGRMAARTQTALLLRAE